MMFTGGSHYRKRTNNNHEGRGRRHEKHNRNAEREEKDFLKVLEL